VAKPTKEPTVYVPRCYVYYNKKTGEILSVTNRKDDAYEHGIEVEFNDIEKFLTGEWHFSDYQVGYHKGSSKTTILAITNEFSGYTFKNNLFEWISESSEPAECIVEWNSKDQVWNFMLSKDFKSTYNTILSPKLVFFVTLENDPDFLIRTIFINTQDLFSMDCVTAPFESTFEKDISKISISSRIVFKNYKLRVVYE
jgi:hypothetical protein